MTRVTLIEFLTARLDEDEDQARDAGGEPWEQSLPAIVSLADGDALRGRYAEVAEVPLPEYAEHIARHDPARVLADVAAKRAILEAADYEFAFPGTVNDLRAGKRGALDAVLRLLALPYADHPDYRSEWRP